MNGRVFVDTNIFVYAHVSNDRNKHEIALNLLRDSLAGSRLWISTQVLGEFYSAMSKNNHPHNKIAEFMIEMMQSANTLPITTAAVESALLLKEKHRFSYWDSLILAAALLSDCDVLYTEDLQHNQVIEGRLIVKNPF